MTDTDTNTTETQTFLTGQVKWFNNKAGYGFITATEGDSTLDIFAHHSAIRVNEEQFKYLVQGEYVQFKKITSESGTHEFQAGEISGVGGGKLMCETRNAIRDSRGEEEGEHTGHIRRSAPRVSQPRQSGDRPRVYVRGRGPREGEEWMLVKRKRGDAEESTEVENNQD
jgi:CspA family cold shock protein